MDLTPALVECSPRNRIDLFHLLCWMRSKRVNVKYTHFLYRFENYNVIVNAFKKLVSNHELQFVAISNSITDSVIPAVKINLYRMFFAAFSVNSQSIFMKFCMDYLRVTRRLP